MLFLSGAYPGPGRANRAIDNPAGLWAPQKRGKGKGKKKGFERKLARLKRKVIKPSSLFRLYSRLFEGHSG